MPKKSARVPSARAVADAEPIVVSEPSPGLYGAYLAKQEITRAQARRLFALLDHYQIDATDPDNWFKLAFGLACDFDPGMKHKFHRRPGPKGSRRWSYERYKALVTQIDAVLAERKAAGRKTKIYDVVCEVVRRNPAAWEKYRSKEASLVTRYHEGKSRFAERAALDERVAANIPLAEGIRRMLRT
jgi:hypothetical protein